MRKKIVLSSIVFESTTSLFAMELVETTKEFCGSCKVLQVNFRMEYIVETCQTPYR
jgi:hypothetical protein